MKSQISARWYNLLLVTGIVLWFLVCAPHSAAAAFTDSVRFFIIEEYLTPLREDPADLLQPGADPFVLLAEDLASRYDTTGDSFAVHDPTPGYDPLRIPLAFDRSISQSGAILNRLTEHMSRNGLVFTIHYPADFEEAIQMTARHISTGNSTIIFDPVPVLLFGFDAREEDPFIYAYEYDPHPHVEIMTQSRLRAEWWLWEEDPRSTVILDITGARAESLSAPAPKEYLEYVLQTAKTDTATGQESYIRPILALIDTLKETAAPPSLALPLQDPSDPYYLRRAEWQRQRFQEYLASLMPLVRDSAVADLRLARYSCDKSVESFAAASRGLYGEEPIPAEPDARKELLRARWVEYRLEAAEMLTDVLRWERQMLEALQSITQIDRPFHEP